MCKTVILCVDDENFILHSLKNELISVFDHQYLIELAENGAEAEEVFFELLQENYSVPVVISDYIMPGMKGDEFLKRIHGLSPKTRKILLTGQATLDGVINSINEGHLFYYIEKPWDKNQLVQVVSTALKGYNRAQGLAFENKTLQSARNDLETKAVLKSKEFEKSILELETVNRRAALDHLARNFLSLHELGQSLKKIKLNIDFLSELCQAVNGKDVSMVDTFFEMEQAVHCENSGEIDRIISAIRDIAATNSVS